jgi:hypothetical protein
VTEPADLSSPVKLRDLDVKPELARSQYSTVHVDKAMITVDYSIQTVTITLLQMHTIPLPRRDEWGVEGIVWDIVGEIKMPIAAFEPIVDYYVREVSNGLQIGPLILKHLQEHPRTKFPAFSYGPTSFKPLEKTQADATTKEGLSDDRP